MSRARRVFSTEFKQEAVELVRRNDRSANQVTTELGVNQTTLSRWRREAEATSSTGQRMPAAEELKQLRRKRTSPHRTRYVKKVG
jgi:transposase-like protein